MGIRFVLLGTLVIFNSGESFTNKANVFSSKLIQIYTNSIGNWAYIIGNSAFSNMFSTALTTLYALFRAMSKTTTLLFNKYNKFNYIVWIVLLAVGTIFLFII